MRNFLKIAAAQFTPIKGNINENIKIHYDFIINASKENVDIIIFPELSLTGYEPELSRDLAMNHNDSHLHLLQNLSKKFQMTIIVGAPIKVENKKPQIGLFIIDPNFQIFHYSKMHLHSGEERFFTRGEKEMVFSCKKHKIGLSICFDSNNPSHFLNTSALGASIYLNSGLLTKNGYFEDTERIRSYAQKHQMAVVMSNYFGSTGKFEAIGKSAIWDNKGNLVINSNNATRCLVIGNLKDKQSNGYFIDQESLSWNNNLY